MFDSLFGAEMPLAVRFFLAFIIVLGLIGATAWAVRRFGAGRLGTATRGRQPRLAVIDYASVDGRRRLILVRRDNVEHLLMIGGPTDVVVEPNIVRATAAPRDVPGARPTAGIEALPRAIPLPETGANGGWPLQPEPALPQRQPRLEPQPQPDAQPRPQRDTLAALADELSARPAPQPRAARQPVDDGYDARQEQRQEARAEPRLEPRRPLRQAPPPPPAAYADGDAENDQSLTDMAQRLEAAMRKPNAPDPRAAPAVDPAPRTPRQPRAEAKPRDGKAALYDNLEQEMASLLGRPNKT
jgi:hypothetical protein